MPRLTQRRPGTAALAAAAFAALALAPACVVEREGPAFSFDRTLKVDEVVRLEVTSGSGAITIRRGSAGSVRVHGDVRAGGMFFSSGQHRAQEVAANPPVEQTGSLIRLGNRRSESPFENVSISYTIETPANTEVIAKTGSGDVDVSGLEENVSVTVSSGSVRLDEIKSNVSVASGSGAVRVSRIGGTVTFTGGSAQATFTEVGEDVRGTSGSGAIEVSGVHGRVNVKTGSGPIRVTSPAEDVRAGTGSGTIELRGTPAADAFWDLGSSSGVISVTVPTNASFALAARTSSGSFKVEIPISIEEQSRKYLRARVGDGKSRVNIETRSGNIRILQGGTS